MSALFKGYAGIVMRASEPQFDAETGAKWVDVTYQGSSQATSGIIVDLEAQGVSYRTAQDGPVYTLTARIPIQVGTDIPPDRYEITSEAQDVSIFELPDVIAAANAYDSALSSEGAQTWRTVIENAVEAVGATGFTGALADTSIEGKVIRHLRAGVTGFQIDYIVLRRFRKIALEYAGAAGKFNLNAGRLLYSAAQLNLPNYVAFALPSLPSAPSIDFQWSYRLRAQRVEITGNFAEQTMELVLAPWSLLAYENASSALNW